MCGESTRVCRYEPGVCTGCTVLKEGESGSTATLVVDGNTDGLNQAPTSCLSGKPCGT